MFTTDRDLLTFEPNLFRDVAWPGQRLASGMADINDFTLSLTSDGPTLEQVGVGAGSVALVGGVPCEVLDRTTALQVLVSRVRVSDDAAPIPPETATGAPVLFTTFAPQIAAVHRRVMRMLGVETQGVPVPGQPKEGQITNRQAFRDLEAFGALAIIFRAAGSLLDDGHPINQRARHYAAAFEEERERVVAHIDANGDGLPDSLRKLSASPLLRG